jgi:O-phosphoseryl-tRNA(Cys) synthetase
MEDIIKEFKKFSQWKIVHDELYFNAIKTSFVYKQYGKDIPSFLDRIFFMDGEPYEKIIDSIQMLSKFEIVETEF